MFKSSLVKIIFTLCLACSPLLAFSQFGIGFHQSNVPFVGINHEIGGWFRPELRIGVDNYFEDLSFEGVLLFDIINKADYEFYLGAGARIEVFEGVVVPAGFNFYPLNVKKFGFHIEIAAIIGDDNILRGSWGVRYRFVRE